MVEGRPRASPPTTGRSGSSSGRSTCDSSSPRPTTNAPRSPTWWLGSSRYLDRDCEDDPEHDATVRLAGYPVKDFDALCELIRAEVEDEGSPWRGRLSDATVAAFVRRLDAARFRMGHLVRGREAEDPAAHRIDWEANQVTVVDIHGLHDRAKRFVTGVVIKRLFEQKERWDGVSPWRSWSSTS